MTDPSLIGGEVGAIIAAVIAALYGADKIHTRQKNKNGNGHVTKEFCEERSANMKGSLNDIKKSIAGLHDKLDHLNGQDRSK